MPLRWTNRMEIAQSLIEAYPHIDRLSLTLPELQDMCETLPDFNDPAPPDKGALEAILWTWMRLADSDGESGIIAVKAGS